MLGEGFKALGCFRIGRINRQLASIRIDNHKNLALDLVKNQDAVHLHQNRIGGLACFGRTHRHGRLNPAHQVVAPIAHQAANALRQFWQMHRLVGGEAVSEHGKRITAVMQVAAPTKGLQGVVAAYGQRPERVAAQKAIAPEGFATLNRFQQKTVLGLLADAIPSGNRCFQISHQFGVDRDEITLCNQFAKPRQRDHEGALKTTSIIEDEGRSSALGHTPARRRPLH